MRFKSQQHKSTFKKAIRKKDKTDTRLMAAMYLLTADQILWNKVKGNIRESRIDYDEVRLDTVSENCYTLYSASKDMYFNTDHVSLSDIFDTKLISEKMYNVIITAINIRRLGLEKAEAIEYQGNIWTHIISLQREDAERLGYDRAEAWMNLLRSKRNAIARSMKIAPENFRWYAAFHKEAAHPHVHMVVYSVNPREGYLTQTGIEQIKSVLAREIFRMDMLDIYKHQSDYRDELRQKARELVEHLVRQVQSGRCDNPKLNELLLQLSDALSHTEGKKVYAYLPPEMKNLVDEIVDELAKDKRIANLYDLWYEQKKEIAAIYTDDPPEKVPLSENEDFRPIKNAVIKEAYNLYLTSVTKLRTRDRSGYAAISALNLLKYLSQMLRDRYYDEQDDLDDMVDSKLRAEINEKKRAQGLKS